MKYDIYPENLKEAKQIQEELARYVKIQSLQRKIKYIAGIDAAFISDNVIGTTCLYSYPALEKVEDAIKVQRVTFPYVPGYLSFRETPVLIKAIEGLRKEPDLILVDGQGIAHPRYIGIASHIGVLLNIPTIGCAKSRLIGEFKEPLIKKGAWNYLRIQNKDIGAVLRTREHVKPLFISPGHLIDIKDSIKIVMKCITKYRIPEPIRCAHLLSGSAKKFRG